MEALVIYTYLQKGCKLCLKRSVNCTSFASITLDNLICASITLDRLICASITLDSLTCVSYYMCFWRRTLLYVLLLSLSFPINKFHKIIVQ